MRELELSPYAPALIESLRAIGYSLESAVADLLDNSISAGAKNISIRFSPYSDPYVAVIDDGTGMTPSKLSAAMRHGSQNPGDTRHPTDLGRFGLGMKTASLSQCAQLTVATLNSGKLSAARWDLDVISTTKKWTLLLLDDPDISNLPCIATLKTQQKGTLVLWRNLDRLSAGEPNLEQGLGDGMVRVREHIALVFHRFLDQDAGGRKIRIFMNGDEVLPRDPFLTWHKATQRLPSEPIRVAGSVVDVQPFILPHYSRLDPSELELAGGEEGLRRQQGFYVYRNRRLIIWGTWFRLARQDELTKLARVRVDMTSALDHLWVLDVMKSAAHPPAEVRHNLRRIIERIGEGSRRVYTYRGRRTNQDARVHLWDRIEGRDGISYRINRHHPIVTSLQNKLDEDDLALFDSALTEVEEMFPAEALYADLASDKRHVHQRIALTLEQLSDLAGQLLDACGPDDAQKSALLANLGFLEPFSHYPTETSTIVNRARNDY